MDDTQIVCLVILVGLVIDAFIISWDGSIIKTLKNMPTSPSPPPTNGATKPPARTAKPPNGTAWCSTAAWQKLPPSTCAKAHWPTSRAASARANGLTRKPAKSATPPKSAPTPCKCSAAATPTRQRTTRLHQHRHQPPRAMPPTAPTHHRPTR